MDLADLVRQQQEAKDREIASLKRDINDMKSVPIAVFVRCSGCGRMRATTMVCPTVAEGGECEAGE